MRNNRPPPRELKCHDVLDHAMPYNIIMTYYLAIYNVYTWLISQEPGQLS